MSIVKCESCKLSVDSLASVCPHCGKQYPTDNSQIFAVLGIFGMAVIAALVWYIWIR